MKRVIQRFRDLKIGTKMLFIILTVGLLSQFLIALVAYTELLNLPKYAMDANIQLGVNSSEGSKRALRSQAEDYLVKIVSEQAAMCNGILRQVAAEVRAMALGAEMVYTNRGNFRGRDLPRPDRTENGVYASKAMLAPGVERTKAIDDEIRLISNLEYLFAPLVRNDPVLDNAYLGTPTGISYRFSQYNNYNAQYDPRTRPWFAQALAAGIVGREVWLDSYVDSYGDVCVTCAKAFRGPQGQWAGVVASDIYLTSMKEKILTARIGKSGYAFLVDGEGTILVHPDYVSPASASSADLAAFNPTPLRPAEGRPPVDPSYAALLRKMAALQEGIGIASIDGKPHYLAFSPLKETGWSLGVVVELGEIVAPAEAIKGKIDAATQEAQEYIRLTLSSVLSRFIIIFALVTMAILILAFVLARSITRPIKTLAGEVTRIGEGDLDHQVRVESADEVGELGLAFNKMVRDLKAYTEGLAASMAEKERIASELELAAVIQKSMLPRVEDLAIQDLDLYAECVAAREVGGDFYDCFFIDEAKTRLGFLIADVAGKGIAAAMFMVVSMTAIKNQLMRGLDPGEALRKANDELCGETKDSNMFVTAFLGILDTRTGEVCAASAGHNPPVLCRWGRKPEFLDAPTNIPLGAFEGVAFAEKPLRLEEGDMLFLYTDGVTEAMNERFELFGNERLLACLDRAPEAGSRECGLAVVDAIAGFVGGSEPSDDLTLLALRRPRP